MATQTDYRLPTGNASPIQFTPSTGENWQCVDDPVGSPDDADYNSRSNTNGTDQFSFSPYTLPNAAYINNVTTYIRVKGSVGLAKARTASIVNGTLYTGTAVGTTSFTDYSTIRTTNPDTNAAWTINDVKGTGSNPLQYFGYRSAVVNTETVQVSQCYHSVNYEVITFKTVTDEGSGADAAPTISAHVYPTDSGSGADSVASITVSMTVPETGTGIDSVNGMASLSVADSGSGLDSITSILANIMLGDTGSGSDAVSSIVASLTITDVSEGEDSVFIAADLNLTDSGSGLDGISVEAAISQTDSGSGSDEIVAVMNSLAVADSGSGSDLVNNILNRLTVSDAGSGSDSVLRRMKAIGKLTVAFTLKKPSVNITIK
jgi:hypothetical protein